MEQTYLVVKGVVYKKIEKVKHYHKSAYHKKTFKINFADIALQIFDGVRMGTPKTVIWLAEIKYVSFKADLQ
jgi:hypothetical protein